MGEKNNRSVVQDVSIVLASHFNNKMTYYINNKNKGKIHKYSFICYYVKNSSGFKIFKSCVVSMEDGGEGPKIFLLMHYFSMSRNHTRKYMQTTVDLDFFRRHF
jgi:hypothetical protein